MKSRFVLEDYVLQLRSIPVPNRLLLAIGAVQRLQPLYAYWSSQGAEGAGGMSLCEEFWGSARDNRLPSAFDPDSLRGSNFIDGEDFLTLLGEDFIESAELLVCAFRTADDVDIAYVVRRAFECSYSAASEMLTDYSVSETSVVTDELAFTFETHEWVSRELQSQELDLADARHSGDRTELIAQLRDRALPSPLLSRPELDALHEKVSSQ